MFISRDGKESHLESLACFSALIVFYRFTLPPTLSKNYELFSSLQIFCRARDLSGISRVGMMGSSCSLG